MYFEIEFQSRDRINYTIRKCSTHVSIILPLHMYWKWLRWSNILQIHTATGFGSLVTRRPCIDYGFHVSLWGKSYNFHMNQIYWKFTWHSSSLFDSLHARGISVKPLIIFLQKIRWDLNIKQLSLNSKDLKSNWYGNLRKSQFLDKE